MQVITKKKRKRNKQTNTTDTEIPPLNAAQLFVGRKQGQKKTSYDVV